MKGYVWRPTGPTPLWSAYQRDLATSGTSFAIPGHKRRLDCADAACAFDRPLELTNDPTRPSLTALARAEALAADAWGAHWARFSVNGSSAANMAALATITEPGWPVVVSRAAHKSVLQGLIMSGALPVWVEPVMDSETGMPVGVDPAAVAAALARFPDATAVVVGSPTYVGTVDDIGALAKIAHRYGIPLMVDAAWGAHFGWHPALPENPLRLGADIMVTSAHKTLPAYTQTAMLLAREGLVDLDRLTRAFDGTQTTSPAVSLLASIDFARALLIERGHDLLGTALEATGRARYLLRRVDGLGLPVGRGRDPLKLVIMTAGAGVDGHLVSRDLLAAGIDVETANMDLLIPQVTLVDDHDTMSDLLGVLLPSLLRHAGVPRPVEPMNLWQVRAETVLTPREAAFAPTVTVPWTAAEGRVCAETVAPYPPGVPVLAPGERVTVEAMQALEQAQAAGVPIAFAADPSLATLRVVA